MKAPIFALSLLMVSRAFAADDSSSHDEWLSEGLARQISKFKRITFTPQPEDHGLVAANCESKLSWWGELRVFHHTGDQIDWMASLPPVYAENCGHYVLSTTWEYLEPLQMWILEIFDSTHMGNGSLWLFTLEGHELRSLLHTTARGRFLKPPPDLLIPPMGGTHLVEEHLNIDYRISDDARSPAIVLTGTIAALDAGDRPQSTKPFIETWIWDSSQRVFIHKGGE
jgi:hypothetical protein